MGNASVKIDALFAVPEFKKSSFGTVGTCAGWIFTAAWQYIVWSICGTMADSSSIKCVMAGGRNEKVGKKANALQETSCQAQESLNSHNLLTFAVSICDEYSSYTWNWKHLKKIKAHRHKDACHLIPATGMTCGNLIQQCHQLFVKKKR